MKLEAIKSSLIVSCQAPSDSPLHDEKIIAAMAVACVQRGAAGVRIDTPAHVREVRHNLSKVPIIGLWKRQFTGYEVYITPRFEDALSIAQAGADIIAIDATTRTRPYGETLKELVKRIKGELGLLVMGDVDSLENAVVAADAGVDLVGTTLYGYTQETKHLSPPGFSLLKEIVEKLDIPAICEGGINTPDQAKMALELGAYAVVVGAAITGIDLKVQAFQTALEKFVS
ncbi:N-acetylmannosamine-6-phosphate 2-epimerase [Gloeothece verrucosa]|uniref:Putative N-acetylmannosamine-6-phosphate 2-epimerase n=1 Tax=Gloeothece verrucosa (strain PCC 7822) TaxID=497965 RepID=E0U999_GLOV7|nr:N-acetylmannosamine-6-phosphate 2-epimerase [Gloeothece verrucosa]ADN17357.1 N-acylglucosamine-6-phosphate 2-epimerase [Gloeothece verrucosa PCC 7822]